MSSAAPPAAPRDARRPGGSEGRGGSFGPVLGVAAVVVTADALTKWLVRQTFDPGQSVEVVGDAIRLTYVLNPGAAFGLQVGAHSRLVFGGLAVVAALVLLAVAWRTAREDRLRLVGLGLILGGALGNLADRVRHTGGVVDFLDVGLGSFRWPVFNLADVGVTGGAFLLVLLLWETEPSKPTEQSEPAVTGD